MRYKAITFVTKNPHDLYEFINEKMSYDYLEIDEKTNRVLFLRHEDHLNLIGKIPLIVNTKEYWDKAGLLYVNNTSEDYTCFIMETSSDTVRLIERITSDIENIKELFQEKTNKKLYTGE